MSGSVGVRCEWTMVMKAEKRKLCTLLRNDVASARPATALFEGGHCDWCGAGRGIRTVEPISCDLLPRSEYAGIYGIEPTTTIVSQRFKELLEVGSGSRLQFKPVLCPLNARRAFYEVLDTAEIEEVASRDLYMEAHSVVCRTCMRVKILNRRPNGSGWGAGVIF